MAILEIRIPKIFDVLGPMSKGKKKDRRPLQLLIQNDYRTALILFILSFAVFAFTAAPSVTLDEDSADFINGVLTLGIVHPPGYPLYTFLGYLFSQIPLGDHAFRVNLFSAFWGALCLGVMFLIMRILSISPTHAVFATLSLGFTTVFWSKTAIAEVYSFNAFLIASIVFWILSYNRDKKKWQFYLTTLTTGLALSNHYPLVILSGVGLLFLLDHKDLRITDYLKGLLFTALGLTPYLYLFIQALNPDLGYNFGKISNFRTVVEHILRTHYNNVYGGEIWDKFVLAVRVLKAIIRNFLLGSFFVFYGIAVSFLRGWNYRFPFLIGALSSSFGLILILSFSRNDTYVALLFDYIIPTFLFLSIFFAVGSEHFINRFVAKRWVGIALLAIALVTEAGLNFKSSSHHNDKLGEVWGTELLNSLEPNSILIVCGPDSFALYYQQLVKGRRPDVTFYDQHSSMTKSNLYEPRVLYRTKGKNEYRKKREGELISSSLRPIYYTCNQAFDEFESTYTPFALRVDKKHSEAADSSKFTVSDRLLDTLANGYPKSEHWADRNRTLIFNRLITYFGGHNLPEANRVLDTLSKTKFYSDPQFLLSQANNLYFFKNHKLARTLYERAEELSLQAFSPTHLAVYCHLLANARNYDKALGICIRQEQASVRCEPNTLSTKQTIAAIYREKGDWPKVAQYARKILECQPQHPVAQNYLQSAMQRIEKRQPATELIAIDESKSEK